MIRELGKVAFNRELAQNFYEAELISPKISKMCMPGQFINIFPNPKWENGIQKNHTCGPK